MQGAVALDQAAIAAVEKCRAFQPRLDFQRMVGETLTRF